MAREMRCENCVFFLKGEPVDSDDLMPDGECHRHAPHPGLQIAGQFDETAPPFWVWWPDVPGHEWCGEWRGKHREAI
jgi:hypothetical protein